ncbi:MarR family winged helix-turn-helix transcriptional regulator [Zhongshania aquimaris]|uniref:MarR family transcriptional regulator n=1 Tax=Zhongshania aquimaris TaxID=2857107 RepID=A0ABS6VWG2_9GAMM|nr:MarR family transcriptional regulator [Zhongshania aquimaris]MBW2942664.1 MarR family transcriptional regulator [Zhongshania aquimaris]
MSSKNILDLVVENPDGPYNLAAYQQNESIGYLLKRCYSFLTNAIDKQLAPYDLTHPQFAFLMTLKQRNCSTAAELARESNLDTGATTRMLDRLEAKDIVLRQRSLEDRRVINIVLTDYGKLVVEKMPVIAINVLNEHLQNFDPDEITTLKRLLTKLIYESENKGCEEKAQSDNAVEGKK